MVDLHRRPPAAVLGHCISQSCYNPRDPSRGFFHVGMQTRAPDGSISAQAHPEFGGMFPTLTQLISLYVRSRPLLTCTPDYYIGKPNMNLTKNITLALGLLAAAACHAQSTPVPTGNFGLLGTRYTELSVGLQDIKHVSDHGYSVGASANSPLIPGVLDGGASYSYSWIRGPFKGHANTVGGYTTAYIPFNGVKPFAGAGLGYQWSSFSFGANDDEAIWGLTAGVEIPAGPGLTFTPRVNYSDDFEGRRNSTEVWTFQVEGNYWFNANNAAFASVGKSEVRRSPL